MTGMVDRADRFSGATVPLWKNRTARALFYQAVVLGLLVLLTAFFVHNTGVNLAKRGIASGFGFLNGVAGFDISFKLVSYSLTSSYGRALLIGLLNTLLVAAVGVVLATVLGFVVGVARLSSNWIIAKLAAVYVDVIRNIPLLAQLIFWYFGVLSTLPGVRQSIDLLGLFFLNQRGLYAPVPELQPGFGIMPVALLVGALGAVLVSAWARRRQMMTGQPFHSFWVGLGLIVGVPLIVGLIFGFRMTWSFPELAGFNFKGGFQIAPEFIALLVGLSIHTSAFIAEIVRSGVQAVSHGQTEAGLALGLKRGIVTRKIVLPQALRVIVPPLTSQYLNLTKNSSLAVFIGFPEVVAVFAGTTLNQTGQAVECIAITMAIYLVISLLISLFMNWYNRHIALVER
ncbi:MAG TPA: amino acid ABC transporter permease [Hypericibacter adhaerens]|uniref:amino acid ABC transporter permease n=1 Tax=Hypericibacter adhaerens TaxID=2602016 RepID=UPI002B99DC01|nr:amino acid ABC transporter permease [Hypericibacter adhaerens]HWA41719.1 amino acid ABC transporter permease [Hypericibacter adhaerens]